MEAAPPLSHPAVTYFFLDSCSMVVGENEIRRAGSFNWFLWKDRGTIGGIRRVWLLVVVPTRLGDCADGTVRIRGGGSGWFRRLRMQSCLRFIFSCVVADIPYSTSLVDGQRRLGRVVRGCGGIGCPQSRRVDGGFRFHAARVRRPNGCHCNYDCCNYCYYSNYYNDNDDESVTKWTLPKGKYGKERVSVGWKWTVTVSASKPNVWLVHCCDTGPKGTAVGRSFVQFDHCVPTGRGGYHERGPACPNPHPK
jgi:hypothetical protein